MRTWLTARSCDRSSLRTLLLLRPGFKSGKGHTRSCRRCFCRLTSDFVAIVGGHLQPHVDVHLIVGRDSRVIHEAQRLILRALGWGLAITLALGVGGGLLLSRGTLRRLEAINRTSREIMAGDLSRRIPPRGTNDDFDQLAENLNAMLDRIEALMAEIRHVTDGIAHDLRSPLTRLRTRLDTIRQRTGDSEEVRRLAAECTAEADQLLATFNALLRIAEAESRRGRSGFTTVDLTSVARSAVELYEPVAQEKRQTLWTNLAANARVDGDPHLLAQALANLLDNAIKYSPEGSRIALSLADSVAISAFAISAALPRPTMPVTFSVPDRMPRS